MAGEGLYEVTIVKYGTRVTSKSEVFLDFARYGEPDEQIRMDYFVWLVRGARRTFVVDTGFSPQVGRARGREVLSDPVEVLSSLGAGPEAAPTVIATHAHYDHIGNLARFARSDVVVAQAELDFWSGPFAQRELYPGPVEMPEIEALVEADRRGRVTTVSGRGELAPGVELIEVGGHTAGQLMVKVQTSAGPVLLASDAVHYLEELDEDRPFAIVHNLAEMHAAFDLVRGMVRSGEVAHVVPGHDPETLGRFGGTAGSLHTTIGSPAPL